jgi:hypothetical protein
MDFNPNGAGSASAELDVPDVFGSAGFGFRCQKAMPEMNRLDG